MTTQLKCIIWDVDGTLAETEETHLRAFNQTFADEGLDWYWSRSRYRELLAVSGGKERMLHFITEENLPQLSRADLDAWVTQLQRNKTACYARLVAAGEMTLRPGVERLIREAHRAGVRLAIATTTSMNNITALFEATVGREVLDWFEVIGAAEQAPIKKPDPLVYRWVLEQLGLPAKACLAIEDTYNGVRAASAADIPVLVTQSYYSEGEDFSGALAVLSHLGEPEYSCQVLSDMDNIHNYINMKQLKHWFSGDEEGQMIMTGGG